MEASASQHLQRPDWVPSALRRPLIDRDPVDATGAFPEALREIGIVTAAEAVALWTRHEMVLLS